MSKISITERVQLITSKVEILKLKTANGGYDWAHISDENQKMLNDTLEEIDQILAQLEKGTE